MSDGNRSLVNWIRRNVPPSAAASARASVVLPTPGMSSIRRWPRDRRVTIAARIASGLPRTTVATASSSLRTAPMSVDDIGAGPKLALEPPGVEPLDTGTAGMSGEYSRKSQASAAVAVQRHEQLQHVPEQRRDGREQHQRPGDVRGRREDAHHEAGLVQDVPGHD